MPLLRQNFVQRKKGAFSLSFITIVSVTFIGIGLLAYHFTGPDIKTGIFHSEKKLDSLFPDAFPLNSPNLHYNVPHHETLNPRSSEDFLITSWISYRRLPAEGERQILLSKFEAESNSRRGYAVALEGGRNYIRPLVYWRNGESEGGWYEFSDFTIGADEWFLLAVSFREGRFLGMHKYTFVEKEKSEVTLLGGYDLSEVGLPDNLSDLKIGSERTAMRAQIGSLNIFGVNDLSGKLRKLLETLAANPLEIPPALEGSGNRFWLTDGEVDRSLYSHEVQSSRSGNRRRRGNGHAE